VPVVVRRTGEGLQDAGFGSTEGSAAIHEFLRDVPDLGHMEMRWETPAVRQDDGKVEFGLGA
jgi:hypothetical protein